LFSDLTVINVIVAESVLSGIPQKDVLLGDIDKKIDQDSAHILPKISGQGKIPTFLFEYHQ
jgi:hypothetical protein